MLIFASSQSTILAFHFTSAGHDVVCFASAASYRNVHRDTFVV